jgi:hypothetical protein
MVGTKNRYYCVGRNHTNVIEDRCLEPSVNGRLLEPFVWDYVMALIQDPEAFEERLRQAQGQEMQNIVPKQYELENIDSLLEQTEEEAEDIARTMTKAKGLVAAKLQQQADEVDRRFQALTARKSELQESLTLDLTDSVIDDLMRFREAVALGLQDPTFEDRRRWLEILRVKVTVTNGRFVISWRLHSAGQLPERTLPIEGQTYRSWP